MKYRITMYQYSKDTHNQVINNTTDADGDKNAIIRQCESAFVSIPMKDRVNCKMVITTDDGYSRIADITTAYGIRRY